MCSSKQPLSEISACVHVCGCCHYGTSSWSRSIISQGKHTKGGCGYCRQHYAHFFSPLLFFRESWLQAGAWSFNGLKECKLCVHLGPGSMWDKRNLPLSNNSLALRLGVGGLKGKRKPREWAKDDEEGVYKDGETALFSLLTDAHSEQRNASSLPLLQRMWPVER